MRHSHCLIFLALCPVLLLAGTIQPSGPARPAAPPPEQCVPDIQLTPETWKKLEMDKYIASIEGIDKMTLTVAKVGAANFYCGIGLSCNAGQLCQPVAGKNWLILVAVQRWNSYLNSLYQGIASAITIVRDASADMITDFIPDTVEDKSIYGWAIATVVVGILGGFTGVLTPFLAIEPILEGVGTLGTAESIATSAAKNFEEAQKFRAAGDVVGIFKIQEVEDARVTGQVISEAVKKSPKLPGIIKSSGKPNAALTAPNNGAKNPHRKRDNRDHHTQSASSPQIMPSHFGHKVLHKRGRGPPSAYAYQRYAEIDTHLAALQNRLQQDVAAVSLAGLTQPIYNENGLAKVLLEGSMLQQFPSQLQDEEKHKTFAKLIALNEIFRAQDMFITLGCRTERFLSLVIGSLQKQRASGSVAARQIFILLHAGWLVSYFPPSLFHQHVTPVVQLTKRTEEIDGPYDDRMRNIIRAEGIHVRNELRNAPILSSKYGFSTEFLTRKAIECQNKYGFYTLGKCVLNTFSGFSNPPRTDLSYWCIATELLLQQMLSLTVCLLSRFVIARSMVSSPPSTSFSGPQKAQERTGYRARLSRSRSPHIMTPPSCVKIYHHVSCLT
ncbi:hypothetical protein VP01_1529g5 [Puccinia sorghi]|uniref:DUF7872 domain-containing protein n=1 Tax=Puccinia sorghi TaxID=27349 RepID=A0A0L6VJ75_9BASI|nr:hypothetical protein VP01_1529g5 [Puccinia sorghi]